jgi:hypothetical protein
MEGNRRLNSSAPINVSVGNRVSFRLYPDTRPHCLEISPLQKGLILLLGSKELIDEGIGFGVPIVRYDKTYFSSSADVTRVRGNNNVLIKSFVLDTISRKRVGKASYINDSLYSFLRRIFEKAYLNCRKLSLLFNLIMALRTTLKVQTDFVKTAPRGTVTVTYTCLPDLVRVNVDLTKLKREGCKQILLLNEQGATFFRKYSDTTGLSLSDHNVGAWAMVKAEEASLSDIAELLSFTLRRVKSAQLFRGWEHTRGRFSWAGLSYSLPADSFNFCYVIKLRLNSSEGSKNL